LATSPIQDQFAELEQEITERTEVPNHRDGNSSEGIGNPRCGGGEFAEEDLAKSCRAK